MHPQLWQHVKDIERAYTEHRKDYERAAEKIIQEQKDQDRITEKLTDVIKYKVTDILDFIINAYPFQDDYGEQLRQQVFFQLNLILVRRRNLNHEAIECLRKDGNIDWFAEPFFGARKLKLSALLDEYDSYRYRRIDYPSADCKAYFVFVED